MRRTKPITELAKKDAKFKANCRKVYAKYDADLKAFGRPVADYNAGFSAGDRNGRRDLSKIIVQSLKKKP